MTKLRLVFDVEEETLVNSSYIIDKKLLNNIAMFLSNLRNSDREVILVTAGAIASGIERLHLSGYPPTLAEKQAVAAIGQVELIKRYQNIFDEYTQMIAQVLLARDIINNPKQQKNAKNTFRKLLSLGIIPIINENDTISTADIEQENNYILTATVASITNAHALIVINKDFSFKVLCKGNNFYYAIASKEDLLHFLSKLDITSLHKKKFSYPTIFPKQGM
jgi:glutamate 5-kinase